MNHWAFIELYEKGRYGQKVGKGFYTYDAETRAKTTDEEVLSMIKNKANEFGISQRDIDDNVW